MSGTTTYQTTSFPSPIINLALGLCFIGCCIGFTIQGHHLWTTTHKWGMMAGGIAFGVVGLIALIRQLTFFVRAERDQLVFLVNFDSTSLPWAIPAIIVAIVGIVFMVAF